MNRPIVVLDVAGLQRGRSHVFGIVARASDEIEAALNRLGEARSQGLHAAGYFSYELGYALELKLAGLIPAKRDLPLLWFGLFRSRRELDSADLDSLIADSARGRAYAGPLRFAETRELYRRKFARVQDYIRAGDAYQVISRSLRALPSRAIRSRSMAGCEPALRPDMAAISTVASARS